MGSSKVAFHRALLGHMGFGQELLDAPGVHVAGDPGRAENKVTVAYRLGEDQLFITCDPAVEALLAAATASMEPTHAAWEQVGPELNGEMLGRGRMQVAEGALTPPHALADGFTMRTLDATDAGDLALVERLVEVSSEEDLDEAEIELDNLDDIIEVVLDADGQIAAFSSSRPFDMAPAFGDIGIMTRTDCRSKGLGSVAVSALCSRLADVGIEPLYRCDEDNIGSVELSRGLDFTIAAMISAYRFPA